VQKHAEIRAKTARKYLQKRAEIGAKSARKSAQKRAEFWQKRNKNSCIKCTKIGANVRGNPHNFWEIFANTKHLILLKFKYLYL